MADLSVIEQDVLIGLLESVGGDAEFLAELLQEYFADSPQQIENMRNAYASGKAEDLRRAAHSMKSNSANFGAMELSHLCKELEDLGKEGNLDGIEARIDLVAAEFAKAQTALEIIQKGI